MFWRFVVGAVKLRRRRLMLAFSAMAVAGALATSLFTVYSDVENRLTRQFQAYGANVAISPAGGAITVPSTGERRGSGAWVGWRRHFSTRGMKLRESRW